jgi:cbb3-type cytochrome oxidase subunit 3
MVVALFVLALGIFSAALPFVAFRQRKRLPR